MDQRFFLASCFHSAALLATVMLLGGCAQKASLSPGFSGTLARSQHGRPASTAGNSVKFLGEPDLSSARKENLSGVLHYCTRNASGNGNMTAAGRVGEQPDDVTYRTGNQGILQAVSLRTGRFEQYALPSMTAPLRDAVCTSVATHLRQPA